MKLNAEAVYPKAAPPSATSSLIIVNQTYQVVPMLHTSKSSLSPHSQSTNGLFQLALLVERTTTHPAGRTARTTNSSSGYNIPDIF